jgi:hypothetical protein
LSAKSPARPWGQCEDGSGCDEIKAGPRSLFLTQEELPAHAANAPLSFAGPLVAVLFLLGLTRHDKNPSRKQ